MSISSMADRVFRVVRRTSELFPRQDVQAAITPLLGKCPVAPALVEFRLWGDDLTGTIKVSGVVDGSSVMETVPVTGPVGSLEFAVVRTCQLFECVTDIATTDLATEVPTPQIQGRFVGEGNQAIAANCELTDCVLGMLDPEGSGGRWPIRQAGGTEQQPTVIGHDDVYDFRPRTGDFYIEQRPNDTTGDLEDYRVWEVVGRPDYLGGLRPESWELNVVERNAADVAEVSA